MSRSVAAGLSPRLSIEQVKGDLSVVGWDSEETLIKAEEEGLQFRQDGDQIACACEGDVALRLPRGSTVSIGTVDGDVSIRSVFGALELGDVHGDLSARDVASLSAGRVGSDLVLRSARGDVHVRKVEGDAAIRDVRGNLSLDSVSDDLVVREVSGNVHADVGEDVVIYLASKPGQVCRVNAGDDILLVLPAAANASLTLQGASIHMQWPGIENDDSTSREVRLGDGSASLSLSGGGEVRVTDRADAGEHADEFGNFAGINFDWSELGEIVGKNVAAATRRAGRKAAAAVKRVERIGARDWAGVRRAMDWARAAGPARQPASEQESLAILRMLQEEKITAEEADKLLAALEGES
jgi:hypothetical protein